MLSIVTTVAVCDATDDDSSTTADNIIKSLPVKAL